MSKTLWAIVILVVIIAILWFVTAGLNGTLTTQSPVSVPVPTSLPASNVSSIVVTGTLVCLPHKGGGPHTMECAYGLRGDDDGYYYALDWAGVTGAIFDLPINGHFQIDGIFVPVESLDSNHWQSYDIRGVIKVDEYKIVR